VVAPSLPTPPDHVAEESSPEQTTLVLASRPTSAASSLAVQERAFSLRPIASVQDILRVTPGLLMVQHSGGGKANQYSCEDSTPITARIWRYPSTACPSTWSRTPMARATPTRTSSFLKWSSGGDQQGSLLRRTGGFRYGRHREHAVAQRFRAQLRRCGIRGLAWAR